MTTTRLENQNRVEARIELARGQETARSGRGPSVQGEAQAGTGFATMLATLGELGTAPSPATVLQALEGFGQAAAAAAASASASVGLERDAKGEALADAPLALQPDAMLSFTTVAAAMAQVQGLGQAGDAAATSADPVLPSSTDTALASDAMLLATNGQMPWASLVGQTAHLDGKADRDLLQGQARDWLSGRGNAVMAMLRQEQSVSAHAAFMSPQQLAAGLSAPAAGLDATAALQGAAAGQALALAAASDANGNAAGLAAAADPLAAVAGDVAGTASLRAATSGAATPVPQAVDAGAAVRQDAALASGVALQGMAAVRPEEWRGFFERAREAGTAASDAAGSTLQGVAAALGAAQTGQQAGQQAPGQDASAFVQAQPEAGASEREQEISEKVAFWVHNKSQNASLTVDHEGQAIQVQVSLQGNEAHVRFGSSEAQARDMLGNGAEQLRELLQAQGLQLAGVSVDVGGQPGKEGRQGAGEPARQGRVSARVDAAGVSEGRTASAGAARTAGGIDLFV